MIEKIELQIILYLTIIVPTIYSAKILFFNGLASHSHLVAMDPLAQKLAHLGHQVTFLTPMTPENPGKVTFYCPPEVLAAQGDVSAIAAQAVLMRLASRHNDLYMKTPVLWDGNLAVCRQYYESKEFQKFIKENTFDLVIADASCRECAMPLIHRWRAKQILFMPSTLIWGEADSFGLPVESSWLMPLESQYDFIPDSLIYEYRSLAWYLWRQFSYIPMYEKLIREKLDFEVPSIRQMERKTAIYFHNEHFASEMARALPDFVVSVGGIHCRETPQGISSKIVREFVEDVNSYGFFYVSFGSFVKVEGLPIEKLKIFFTTMGSFKKYKFLWKFHGHLDKSIEVPKNVMLAKWFTQQEILGHPKIKGFVSQGGLMSFQQSIFHKVPLIILPCANDQIMNGRLTEERGMGIHLEFSELNEEKLSSAFQQLLDNETYVENMKRVSLLFRDRPQSALDTAVWWSEWVLRHDDKDFEFLKSKGMNQYWWERRMIHLWAIVLSVIIISFISFVLAIYKLFQCLGLITSKRNSHTTVKPTTKMPSKKD